MTKILKNLDKIERIEEDYMPHFDILMEEGNITYQIKQAIFNKLDVIDRRVLLLYAETMSLRKVGQILGVSTSKVYSMISRIRNIIKNELNNN